MDWTKKTFTQLQAERPKKKKLKKEKSCKPQAPSCKLDIKTGI